jgi:hypothetical protein
LTIAPQEGCSFNLGGGSSYITFVYNGAIQVYQALNQDAQFTAEEQVLSATRINKDSSVNYINFGLANYDGWNDQSVRIIVFKQSALMMKSAVMAVVGLAVATSLF